MWEQQSLFDIDYYVKLNVKQVEPVKPVPEPEIRPCQRPDSDLPYYDNPENDNELLMNYQHDWIVHADFGSRQKMFELGYKVMKRLLWRKMKKGGVGYLDEEQQSDIVSNAFVYVFRRFDYGYVVNKNFLTVLNDGLRHALFYRTMANSETSLDAIKGDYTNKIEHIF